MCVCLNVYVCVCDVGIILLLLISFYFSNIVFHWEIQKERNSQSLHNRKSYHWPTGETCAYLGSNLWSIPHTNDIIFDRDLMIFKSDFYKPFIAISNPHRQPYSVFMNPFGAYFLPYLHFIGIGERQNINFLQKFLSLDACNHIQKRIC